MAGIGLDNEVVRGVERAVFGPISRKDIDAWVGKHVRARLGVAISGFLFRSGRVAAVYGAVLDDGRRVAVKVHRRPVNAAYLSAAIACQRRLADAGFPCPRPLDGPATTEDLTAVIETLVRDGEPGDGHKPGVRRAIARSLFEHIELLQGHPVDQLAGGAPAWTRYQDGPWPQPHDPIFDFTTTPPEFAWLDDLALRAAAVLGDAGAPELLAHADWSCGNLRFHSEKLSASYDWDSLAVAPEAVLVGLCAGDFTSGGAAGADTPTLDEMTAFLRDYEEVRGYPFNGPQQNAVAAAITWVLAYNARCEVSFMPPRGLPRVGFPLEAISTHRDSLLSLRW